MYFAKLFSDRLCNGLQCAYTKKAELWFDWKKGEGAYDFVLEASNLRPHIKVKEMHN